MNFEKAALFSPVNSCGVLDTQLCFEKWSLLQPWKTELAKWGMQRSRRVSLFFWYQKHQNGLKIGKLIHQSRGRHHLM